MQIETGFLGGSDGWSGEACAAELGDGVHVSLGFFETCGAHFVIVDDPFGKPDGAFNRQSVVIDAFAQIFERASLFDVGVDLAKPGLDGVVTGFGGDVDFLFDGEFLAADGTGIQAVGERFGGRFLLCVKGGGAGTGQAAGEDSGREQKVTTGDGGRIGILGLGLHSVEKVAFFLLIGNEFRLQLFMASLIEPLGCCWRPDKTHVLIWLGLCLLLGGHRVHAADKLEFFVAPYGSDQQPGSKAAPFATLARARDAVREVDRAGGREIRVWLRAGVYRMQEAVVFSLRDSAGPGSRVVYASFPGEKAVLSGAAPLPGEWEKTDRENVWQIDVPDKWREIRALFDGEKMLPRARSEGVVPLGKVPDNVPYRFRRAIDLRHLYLPGALVKKIGDFRGASIELVPKYPWVMNRLSVESVDAESGLLRTVEPATYAMVPPPLSYFPAGTLWVENVLSVLDEPGEWVHDSKKRKLYLWPPDGKKPGKEIVVGRGTELIAIKGEIDATDLKDRPVTGLSFHGLTFTQGNAFAWDADKSGKGLQHDWEMYDKATAMVRLRGAEDCMFTQCEFVDSAAAGIRLDLHCQRNEIRRCEFSNLGGVGVLMAGYGMGMKDVNRDNVIADSEFHHIGRLWKHSPAIFIWQSGHNRLVHNTIHHVPYTAIVVSGRTQLDRAGDKEASRTVRWDELNLLLEGEERSWQNREPLMHGRLNTIAYNDIHHCMEKMGDGNAIYVSGTGRGNHVHHNFIHDVTSPNMNAAIRCDDDQHGVLIEKNVIARCCGEGFISKGRNDIVNNIVYDLRSRTPGGVEVVHQRGFILFPSAPVTGSRVQGNLFVSREAGQAILYEHQKAWKRGKRLQPPASLSSCKADRNLYFNSADKQWAAEFLQGQRERGVEKNSVSIDPGFVDPEGNDFRVGAGAVVGKLGFEPIDVRGVGVRGLGIR